MSEEEAADEFIPEIPNHSRRVIFVIGVLSLALVPVFQMVTNLPPFLGYCWDWLFYGYIPMSCTAVCMCMNRKTAYYPVVAEHRPGDDLFFLGILMAVGALETSGQLGIMSAYLDKHA